MPYVLSFYHADETLKKRLLQDPAAIHGWLGSCEALCAAASALISVLGPLISSVTGREDAPRAVLRRKGGKHNSSGYAIDVSGNTKLHEGSLNKGSMDNGSVEDVWMEPDAVALLPVLAAAMLQLEYAALGCMRQIDKVLSCKWRLMLGTCIKNS
jgi:hypothetical protein